MRRYRETYLTKAAIMPYITFRDRCVNKKERCAESASIEKSQQGRMAAQARNCLRKAGSDIMI